MNRVGRICSFQEVQQGFNDFFIPQTMWNKKGGNFDVFLQPPSRKGMMNVLHGRKKKTQVVFFLVLLAKQSTFSHKNGGDFGGRKVSQNIGFQPSFRLQNAARNVTEVADTHRNSYRKMMKLWSCVMEIKVVELDGLLT